MKFVRNTSLLIILAISLVMNVAQAAPERVITLPDVEVDTLAFPALRILKQLQQHEKEDRFATLQSFDVHTEGDYISVFNASKFLRGYMRGIMSAMGFPRMSKIFLGNDTVTYKIHAQQQYGKRKLKDVDVRLDSSNLDLTAKQYKLIKRSNLDLDDMILTQFRSPKQPWGSKRYDRYDWLLVDTLTMDGHRVNVLQFASRPPLGRVERLRGPIVGKIWVIEDYWRIVGYECQSQKNHSSIRTHLQQVAPGVFLPSELTVYNDMELDPKLVLAEMNLNLDSLPEKKRRKLDKMMSRMSFSVQEGHSLRMTYDNVVEK